MTPTSDGWRGACRAVAAVGAVALLLPLAAAPAGAGVPEWQPEASERLIKMPSSLMQRTIEKDFRASPLARALETSRGSVKLKTETLAELQDAAELENDPETKTELRHQFLVEKKSFIELVGEQVELSRQATAARMKVYEQLLRKLEKEGRGLTPEKVALISAQEAAHERMRSTLDRVDLELFGSQMAEQSKYSKAYARNRSAIERLTRQIGSHPMNDRPTLPEGVVSKQDYLRHLLADGEADLAIFDQEEQILGYMAKLVALDAMALAEGLDTGEPGEWGAGGRGETLTSAVDFFTGE